MAAAGATGAGTPDISLAGWFAGRARLTPKRRALTFEGTTWTYEAMADRIGRVATVLRDGGVRHGDRVAFLGLNGPGFFEVMFGAARLGAIFVPLNFRLTGPELSFIVNDAGVHTLVADDLHRAVIDGVRDELPCRRYVSSEGAQDGWETLDSLRDAAAPFAGDEPVAGEEVAVIMYTSGTTGRPKGAMLTHANLWWNNTAALLLVDTIEDDVSLVVAPLFHIGGLNVTTLQAWMKGAEIVLHRSFDPGKFLADIAKYGVTTTFAVPAMLLFASQHPDFDSTDLTTMRSIICGGAPVPEPLIKHYNGRGIQVNQGYGLTETSPCVSFLTPEFGLAKLGSAGRPPMFVDVRLVGDGGEVVTEPLGRGEVCVRGPNVMKGYWNRPDATAAAIDPDGWFHTGDIGYFDDEGFLYICDRVKDMIISGGENVYPAEVESALFDHPAVADIAVIGLPDERWGEAVVAVAVLSPGAELSLEGLREYATDHLAKYKIPTRLETVDVLPRNPAGKVLKFELRERFSG
ncbi:MAG TPA: long-chain fatty acid--CoA ligase [Acidimicrobiales bacterium]|nr:long-chain fatty acid--CoA ligase [Acidimicrobiales bacterium]